MQKHSDDLLPCRRLCLFSNQRSILNRPSGLHNPSLPSFLIPYLPLFLPSLPHLPHPPPPTPTPPHRLACSCCHCRWIHTTKAANSLSRGGCQNQFTWYGLAVHEAHDLPVEDTTPPAESFEELHLLLIDDVLHSVGVFPQLREGVALSEERMREGEEEPSGNAGELSATSPEFPPPRPPRRQRTLAELPASRESIAQRDAGSSSARS